MQPTPDQLANWTERLADEDDRPSFNALFGAFYERLVRFALHYAPPKENAEEVVQDVFVTLWERRRTLREVQNLRAYLFAMTRNGCFQHLRRARPDLRSLDDLDGHETPSPAPDPEGLLLAHETEQAVERAIGQLPPRCRMIFQLVREQGLSYREAAEVLGLSPRTIEAQMGIALRKLVEALQPAAPGR
jgi:RNA polymerase sigma-70 factor (ECF subfamily)